MHVYVGLQNQVPNAAKEQYVLDTIKEEFRVAFNADAPREVITNVVASQGVYRY